MNEGLAVFVSLKICKYLHCPLFMLCLKNLSSEVLQILSE